jgi:glutathione S-transferase
MSEANHPTLYSFRRCPYAMRARLGITLSQQHVQLREIILRNKPDHMVEISPKATVPVLQLNDGTVIDESLDIAKWALSINDPQQIMCNIDEALIAENDGTFKHHLDRYKYASRHDPSERLIHRSDGSIFLNQLNERLTNQPYLCGDTPSFTDFMIAPFIRQFAHVDRDWFFSEEWEPLINWLSDFIESDLFLSIMKKYKPWLDTNEAENFPDVNPTTHFRK